MDKKNIHKGHREKMRRRFFESGLAGFAPHEIVEFLLFFTIPRQNTNEMAHRLINKFTNIADLFDAPIDALRDAGLSDNTASLFKIIPQIFPVYYASKASGETYDNCSKLKELFTYQYPGIANEQFRIACFDNNLHLINNKVYITDIGIGTHTVVNFRKITELIVKNDTYNVAVSHNHPNALPVPSPEDINVTRNLNRLLKAIGVNLFDHIIVGRNDSFSMRENDILGVFD
jgi:DNA repair protein RadC